MSLDLESINLKKDNHKKADEHSALQHSAPKHPSPFQTSHPPQSDVRQLAANSKTQTLKLEHPNLPILITKAGDKAQYKFLEFFMATLSNKNTREAYARASFRFLEWCDLNGLELSTIHPIAAAAYFRTLEDDLSPASVKQHLSSVKALFDWFVTEGITSYNPVASVKGPKYSPKRGKTTFLTPQETRTLFDSILNKETKSIKDYRDLAILSVLFYAWVRVSALIKMNVSDYKQIGDRYTLRFKEKGGKPHDLPAHHKVTEYLNLYLHYAQINQVDPSQRKQPLFRTLNRYKQLSPNRMNRKDILRMIKKRSLEAGLTSDVTVHTARATGITTFLENRGSLEQAQDIANHADPRTTRLYDRRRDRVEKAEIERVQY